MSRLDFCKYELVDDCYDWKNDNCDECNIFKAYCEGEIRAKNSIVRCKDCDNRHTDDCPMYHEEWYEIDEGDGYFDSDFTVHDYSTDDGFCSWAKMKGSDTE